MDLKANQQGLEGKNKTILRGQMSFLPQEVVMREVWINGLQKKHRYRRRSPRRDMSSNTHPNEWVQYIFQLQFMVQSHKDQDEARTFIIFN